MDGPGMLIARALLGCDVAFTQRIERRIAAPAEEERTK